MSVRPPIRVLHVLKTLELGGAERNLFNLVRHFDPSRVEAHVAYCWGGQFEEAFRGAGVPLFKCSGRNHKLASLETPFTVARLRHYLRSRGIGIVQTHNFNAHIMALAAAKLAGARVIEHVHDFRYIEPAVREAGGCHVKQYRHIGRFRGFSDRVVVLTAQNRDYVVRHGLAAASRVRVIRNGIPLDSPRTPKAGVREALGIGPDRSVFLTPVRMSPEKNIDLIFRAAPMVAARRPDACFLLAGDGPLLEAYRARARRDGLEGVLRFVGFYPETQDLLAFSRALVLPSFLELHPIAILEALAAKVPILAAPEAGCNAEVFTNWRDAVLLDPREPGPWADALVRLLEDGELARGIAERGYELCRLQFDVRRAARDFEALYEELAR